MRKLQTCCLSALALALAACQTVPPARTAGAPASSVRDPAAILSGGMVPGSSAIPPLPPAPQRKVSPYAPAEEDLSTRGDYVAGGLYKPGVKDSIAGIEVDADAIPEPEVVELPRSRYGNMPVYSVLGKQYFVLADTHGYREEGTASYYGKKFHGRRTSAQEVYDMYAFSAAHKTLPIPSFARVTNLDNGKSVVVRVNDRGPFHEGRVIDLSLAAATKIGIVARGTGRVRVEALQPDRVAHSAAAPGSVAAAASAAAPSLSPLTQSLTAHFAPQAQAPTPAPAAANVTPQAPAQLPAAPQTQTQQTQPAQTQPTAVVPAPVGVPSEFMPAPMVPTKPHATTATSVDRPAPTAVTQTAPGTTPVAVSTPQVAAANAAAAAQPYDNTVFRPDAARFNMHPGQPMNADRFDDWLKDQKITIATGKPRPVDAPPLPATSGAVLHQAVAIADLPGGSAQPVAGEDKSVVFAPSPNAATPTAPATAPVSSTEPKPAPGEVILQVASFSSQANATEAAAKLTSAGITGVRLLDGFTAAGARIWRLRVGPVLQADSSRLIQQIASLGLGQAQRVL